MVAPCQSGAADMEFARNANRQRLHIAVQHVGPALPSGRPMEDFAIIQSL